MTQQAMDMEPVMPLTVWEFSTMGTIFAAYWGELKLVLAALSTRSSCVVHF